MNCNNENPFFSICVFVETDDMASQYRPSTGPPTEENSHDIENFFTSSTCSCQHLKFCLRSGKILIVIIMFFFLIKIFFRH